MVGLQTGMGLTAVAPQVHLGLNKFDFDGLLKARYRKTPPPGDLMSNLKPFSQPGRHRAGQATRRDRQLPRKLGCLYRAGRGRAPVFDQRPQRPDTGGQFGRRNQPDYQRHVRRRPNSANQPAIADEKLRCNPIFYSLRAFFLQSFNKTLHITDAASRSLLSHS